MPYLALQTNVNIDENEKKALLGSLSENVARLLAKPESYVMIALNAATPMMFGGSEAPLAYIELKSLGLPEDKTADFSSGLCELISTQLNIPQSRIYIEFAGPARHMWGWDGRTF